MIATVVDASVAAKWFVEEEHDQAALALLDRRHRLHAPDFFLLEMDNIVLKWVRRGTLTATEGEQVRSEVRRVPMRLHPSCRLLDAAYQIASSTGRSAYDALYVALAVSLDCQVAAADRRLHDAVAAGPLRRHVLWVEDIE